jgi:hypothetical protein
MSDVMTDRIRNLICVCRGDSRMCGSISDAGVLQLIVGGGSLCQRQ